MGATFYPLDAQGLCVIHRRRHHPGLGCPVVIARAEKASRVRNEREDAPMMPRLLRARTTHPINLLATPSPDLTSDQPTADFVAATVAKIWVDRARESLARYEVLHEVTFVALPNRALEDVREAWRAARQKAGHENYVQLRHAVRVLLGEELEANEATTNDPTETKERENGAD